MDKAAQKEFAITKVLARADQWLTRRKEAQAAQRGPQEPRVRALGRYEKAGDELAESVEKLRATEKTEAHLG